MKIGGQKGKLRITLRIKKKERMGEEKKTNMYREYKNREEKQKQ